MTGHERIPVIVIGGFLGSGKTTLLNGLIDQADGKKIAALVNDFGALNVDADLVVGVEGTTVSLANGCVCCTIHDDLARACLALLVQETRPDLVLVELSGVSNPGPVLDTFLETELRPFFDLSAVVTVVDAAGWSGLDGPTSELAGHQVAAADIVALSKTDLASAETISATTDMLRNIRPGAPILPAHRGQVPLAALLDTERAAQPWKGNLNGGHGLSTVTWTCDGAPVSLPMMERFLASRPAGMLRIKGFLWLEELPQLKFLLQVSGGRHEISCLGSWQNERPSSAVVVIGTPETVRSELVSTQLDHCRGRGDLDASPILRLVHRIAPELLEEAVA